MELFDKGLSSMDPASESVSEMEAFHSILYNKKAVLRDIEVGKLLDFTVPFPIVRDGNQLGHTSIFIRNHYENLWGKIKE